MKVLISKVKSVESPYSVTLERSTMLGELSSCKVMNGITLVPGDDVLVLLTELFNDVLVLGKVLVDSSRKDCYSLLSSDKGEILSFKEGVLSVDNIGKLDINVGVVEPVTVQAPFTGTTSSGDIVEGICNIEFKTDNSLSVDGFKLLLV